MEEIKKIETTLVKIIIRSLLRGKSVNRNLPDGGKIVIDQLLPYLCVYRYPQGKKDSLLAGLLRTQAAYLIIREDIDISDLLSQLSEVISAKFKAVLIIEMWPSIDPASETVKILAPERKAPATTRSLKEGFDEVRKDYSGLGTEIEDQKRRHPDHLTPLLSLEHSKEVGSLIIGIEFPPIYWHTDKEHFALLYRKLKTRVSGILKKAAFEFIRVQTSNEFTHYLMLGKTILTNLVRSADRRIAEVSERMNFLLRVSPVNDIMAWEQFKESGYKNEPILKYRLIPLDPELEKRKLYDIELERIEDPTLVFLLRNKRRELELQLTMLEARQTPSFRHYSQALYGETPASTKQLAREILEKTSADESKAQRKQMNSEEFAALAQRVIDVYAGYFPGIKLGAEIRHDLTGLMVSKSKLLIGDTLQINPLRAEALIQHEVSTHILTYCNGKIQPLQQLYAGLDGYDQLQEGLAVLSEYLAGGLTASRLRLLAARVIAVDMMMKDVGFVETFNYLYEQLKFTPVKAFDITTRVFRGGGYTKDAVYLRGLEKLLQYLRQGGKLETLYLGKFDFKHVNFIEELVHRNVLVKPVLPSYLERDVVREKINKVKEGITTLELLS